MNPPRNKLKLRLVHPSQELEVEATSASGVLTIDASHATRLSQSSYHVLVKGDGGRQYPLGLRPYSSGVIDLSKPSHESETPMEASAVTRLCTILRLGQDDARIQISAPGLDNDRPVRAHLKALTAAPAAPMFITKTEAQIEVPSSSTCKIQIDLTGVSFAFEVALVDQSGLELAWRLPKSATRLVRRAAPRRIIGTNYEVPCVVGDRQVTKTLVDLSPLGCGLAADSEDLGLWDEVALTLRQSDGSLFKVSGIISETAVDGRIGCIFATSHDQFKIDFLRLHGLASNGLTLRQRAEDAWKCLEENGYLDLVSEGLHSVKEACLEAWQKTDLSREAFQPVAYIDGAAIGTIGAAQVEIDHWVPHSLATTVDPKLLEVTEALYQSWPLYVLAQGLPSWFSTWYDAEKPWHNRFYQVFLLEHARDNSCFSFVRHWHWCADTSGSSKEDCDFSFRQFNPDADADLSSAWAARYDGREMPILKLRKSEFFEFVTEPLTFLHFNRPIGILKLTTSRSLMNPFGVFTAGHLNLLVETSSPKSQVLEFAARKFSALMHSAGVKTAALSTDYDCEADLGNCGFVKFAPIRCLTANSEKLGSLISNNALCFAEIRARYT